MQTEPTHSSSPSTAGARPGAWWRVQRAVTVGWRRRAELLRTPPLLALVSLRLRRHGYAATTAWLDRRAGRGPGATRAVSGTEGQAAAFEVAYVVRAAARMVPDATCLRRALVLRHLLGRAGIASTIRLGVRPVPGQGAMAFHAWVVVGDTVISEPERLIEGFVVLDTGQPPPGVAP